MFVALLVLAACSNEAPAPDPGSPVAVSLTTGSPFDDCTADRPVDELANPGAEVEPTIAVDPNDPDRIAVAWQQDRWFDGAARGIAVASSSDGGETWKTTTKTKLSPCSGRPSPSPLRVTDPWLTFGADGTLHLSALAVDVDPRAVVGADREEVLATRSTDGGITWSHPAVLVMDSDPQVYNDKPSLTADPTDPNLVYAVWHRLIQKGDKADGETVLARSTDAGATWERPQVILGPLRRTQSFGNEIIALQRSDSSALVNVFTLVGTGPQGDDNARVAVMRSTDAGATWSEPVVVDELRAASIPDPATGSDLKTGRLLPRAAADPGGGAMYVAWSDSRYSNSGNGVVLAMSTDAGASWSQPAPVGQASGGAGPSAFTPEIAVTAEGAVGVTYYDFRSDADVGPGDPLMIDLFLAVCSEPIADNDGCSSEWIEERVTDRSFDLRFAPQSGGPFLGDYVGLAGAGDAVVSAFTVARSSGDPASIFVSRFAPQP